MRTLHCYLVREMLATILVAVTVCTGLLLVGNLLKEILALLMAGQVSIGLVVRAIALLIPFVLAFSLPMGALTAALLVFGRFSADQELTAARANGISLSALAFPVLLLSLVLCAFAGLINLDIAPRCRMAYKKIFAQLAQRAPTLIPAGRFVTDIPGFVIYADRVDPLDDGGGGVDLHDVLFFELQNGRKVRDIRAPRARLERSEADRELRFTFFEARYLQWVAHEPSRTNSAERSEGVDVNGGLWVTSPSMGEVLVQMPLPEEIDSRSLPEFSEMTWRQLLSERRELQRLGLTDLTPLDLQIHRAIAFSFASFGFALVGIPMGVRSHRRETTVGVAVAIALVLIYYGFLIVAQNLQTRPEMAPWLIVWLPNFFFQFMGGWLLWRANRGR